MNLSYFLLAASLSAAASSCSLLVLARMRSVGYRISFWRPAQAFAACRDYWRVSPQKKWSRMPLILGISCLLMSFYFFSQALPFPIMEC